jgi:hypothetical protein
MVIPLPILVRNMLAKREHRMHHFVWHAVRDGWRLFSNEDRESLKARGWAPPRPSFNLDGDVDITNSSGEDFLFMHREMINHVNVMLHQIQDPTYPKVVGWDKIPSPKSSEYPVPPVWDEAPFLAEFKTNEYYSSRMKPLEDRFTNLDYLAQITLGELGALLEYSIHAMMHLRWSSKPSMGIRPDVSPVESDTIDTMWDKPSYDFLGEFYSSHVNPVFWKLHGWIDNRIEDWKVAHNIVGEVPWSVAWDKNMMPHHNIVHSEGRLIIQEDSTFTSIILDTMQAAMIIEKTRVFPSIRVLINNINS